MIISSVAMTGNSFAAEKLNNFLRNRRFEYKVDLQYSYQENLD